MRETIKGLLKESKVEKLQAALNKHYHKKVVVGRMTVYLAWMYEVEKVVYVDIVGGGIIFTLKKLHEIPLTLNHHEYQELPEFRQGVKDIYGVNTVLFTTHNGVVVDY